MEDTKTKHKEAYSCGGGQCIAVYPASCVPYTDGRRSSRHQKEQQEQVRLQLCCPDEGENGCADEEGGKHREEVVRCCQCGDKSRQLVVGIVECDNGSSSEIAVVMPLVEGVVPVEAHLELSAEIVVIGV